MIKSALLVVVLVLATVALVSSASADDGGCSATGSIAGCLGQKDGTIDVTGEEHRRESGVVQTRGRPNDQSAQAAAIAAFCADAVANADAVATAASFTEIVPLCHGFAALPATPSPGQVISAFRELGLYDGAVESDPAGGTLVNLETFFWCGDGGRTCGDIGEGERTVTLLGQVVRIRPRIVGYRWDFGDGTTAEIETGRVQHTYLHAIEADVSVTLTWTADYAVGADAFTAIGETTTTTSPVRTLPVHEAQAVIVR